MASKSIKYYCNKLIREATNKYRRHRVSKVAEIPSIITSFCIGGMAYHDLGMQFMSPFINTYIEPEDFVKLCGNLKYYLSLELQKKETVLSYPVAMLGDIEIDFPHDSSFEVVVKNWEKRKTRINYNNLIFITIDRQSGIYPGTEVSLVSEETIKKFEELPYERKYFLINRYIDNSPSMCQIKAFENYKIIPVVTDFYKITGRRIWELPGGIDTVRLFLNKR